MSGSTLPLFLFGVARSGTSYTHHLLNEHPAVRLTYEGRLVREGEYYYGRAGRLTDRNAFAQLMHRFAACEAAEPQNGWLVDKIREREEEAFAHHLEHPSYPGLVEYLHVWPDQLSCWGSKLLRLEALPDLQRHWPDLRAIILVRDPRAVYASQRKFWRTRIGYSAIYWNLHSVATRAIELDPHRHLVFRYEDLVLRFEETSEKLFRFAGVWDPGIVASIRQKMAPRPASLEKWKEDLSTSEVETIEELCFDEMQAWGYEPSRARSGRSLGLVSRSWETLMENRRLLRWDVDYWRRKQVVRRFLHTIRGQPR